MSNQPDAHNQPSLKLPPCPRGAFAIIRQISSLFNAVQSSEYESRLEMLPAYRESLHLRYPPVCDSCLPQVEAEIRKKEQMARVKALGGWLSKGKERKRRVSVVVKEDDGIRYGTTEDKLAKIKSAFPQWGNSTTTGGNASQITDGAAAVLVMTRREAERRGLSILAKHITTAVAGALLV